MKLEEMINQVIQGDCLEVLKSIPDKSIDLVLTDPPYGVTGLEWDNDNVEWIKECLRITKNSVVCFATQPFTTKVISNYLEYYIKPVQPLPCRQ